MDPYHIFPRELWEMIFNHVEDPQDKLTLMRSHPNLQNQFREMEEELLFLSALPFFLDNLESSARQIRYWERQQQREVFLTFRSVSSSSCRVVDKWMESFWEKSEGDHHPPSFLDGGLEGNFWLVKFTEDFSNHPDNRTPLLSRFVTCGIPNYEPTLAPFREKLDCFFRELGRHLRKLTLRFAAGNFRQQELGLSSLNSLQNMLMGTPNLRSLTLNLCMEQMYYINQLTMVNQQPFQFPQLPQLDHLVLDFWERSGVLLNTFASIREYFPQLVELQIRDILNFRDDYLKNAELFPNLKTLKLRRNNLVNYPTAWEPKLRRICTKIRAPKLTYLEVYFDMYGKSDQTRAYHQTRVELLTRHSLFCLNKLNTFYSHLEPEFQWTGCSEVEVINEDEGSMKIKLSRKLK